MKIITILILLLSTIAFAEHPDTTITKLQQRAELIEIASKTFGINSKILTAIIFTERTLNYTWEDEAMDNILAEAGLNSSIGFCQVKLKTAYWIEVQLNDTSAAYFPNKAYKGKISLSNSPDEIINKLENDLLNILYAAAFVRIAISYWEKAGFPIDNKADILGTLYSTGLFKRDGTIRIPNKNPKANEFGKRVGKQYNKLARENDI